MTYLRYLLGKSTWFSKACNFWNMLHCFLISLDIDCVYEMLIICYYLNYIFMPVIVWNLCWYTMPVGHFNLKLLVISELWTCSNISKPINVVYSTQSHILVILIVEYSADSFILIAIYIYLWTSTVYLWVLFYWYELDWV